MFTPRLPTFQTTVQLWHCPDGDGVYSILSVSVAAQLYTTRWKQPMPLFIDEIGHERGPLARQEGPAFQLLLLPASTGNVQLLDPFSQPHDWHGLVVHSDSLLGEKLYLIDYVEVRWQGWPNQHYGLLLRRIARTEDPRNPAPAPATPDTWCVDIEQMANGTCLSCEEFNLHVELPRILGLSWASASSVLPCEPGLTYRWVLTAAPLNDGLQYTLTLEDSTNATRVEYQSSSLAPWTPGNPLPVTLVASDGYCDWGTGQLLTQCPGATAPTTMNFIGDQAGPGVGDVCSTCNQLRGTMTCALTVDTATDKQWIADFACSCYDGGLATFTIDYSLTSGLLTVTIADAFAQLLRYEGTPPIDWNYVDTVQVDITLLNDPLCVWPSVAFVESIFT